MNARTFSQSGVTLIETLVALAIGAVFAAVSAPAMIDLIAGQRVKNATFDFYSTLVYARSEAIKRDAVVDVAPHDGDFAKGWDVRIGGTVLRSQNQLASIVTAAPDGVALSYANDGRLTAAGRYVFTLAAADKPGVTMRCVVIDPSGRASVRLDNNRDGNCFNG